jgi:hypothetical protein
MAPKQGDPGNTDVMTDKNNGSMKKPKKMATLPCNTSLVEGAGDIHLQAAEMWGRGIVNDFKRTVGTHWFEEMTNFNHKTVAVTLLVFISVIAPTLTFGAVYGKVTNNNIGAIETLLATAWVGMTYSLIGGMPVVSNSEAVRVCFRLGVTS